MKTLALCLGLTLALELPVAAVWGLRSQNLGLCALVNILTNPVVVALHSLFPAWQVTALLELAAVLTEGCYYRRFAPQIRKPFLLSLTANVVSFGTGLLLNTI